MILVRLPCCFHLNQKILLPFAQFLIPFIAELSKLLGLKASSGKIFSSEL